MHFSTSSVALLAFASSTQALSFSSLSGLFRRDWPHSHSQPESRQYSGTCPAVWTQISSDLTNLFLSGGACNDDARAAIRAVFHDCFPGVGCDGSLALPEELARHDNQPMAPTVLKLQALAVQYNVTVADMIAFAGCRFIFQAQEISHANSQ
jgi:hypothetical protein